MDRTNHQKKEERMRLFLHDIGDDSYLRNPDSQFLFVQFFSSLRPMIFPQSAITNGLYPLLLCAWAFLRAAGRVFSVLWSGETPSPCTAISPFFVPSVSLVLYNTRRLLLDRRYPFFLSLEYKNILAGGWLSTRAGQETRGSEQIMATISQCHQQHRHRSKDHERDM